MFSFLRHSLICDFSELNLLVTVIVAPACFSFYYISQDQEFGSFTCCQLVWSSKDEINLYYVGLTQERIHEEAVAAALKKVHQQTRIPLIFLCTF